jgi:hypothetical protein
MKNLVAQETRPQLQVGWEFELPAILRISASWAPSLMELVFNDVKSVALAKIQAVKNLGRAIDYAESVAQEAKRTLVAARLTQVLLIERDSPKNQSKHCARFRVPSGLLTRFARRCQVLSKCQVPIAHVQCGVHHQEAQ